MDAITAYLSEFVDKLTEPLVLFGFAGQAVFMARFIVQWYVSEKRKRSTVPVAFWYISTLGGCMLFTYGLLDRDPVILVGQGLGIGIYVRNLWLIHRRAQRIRDRAEHYAAQRAAAESAPNQSDHAP